jgi:hypothetical protein
MMENIFDTTRKQLQQIDFIGFFNILTLFLHNGIRTAPKNEPNVLVESLHKNPLYIAKERFVRLEEKVANILCNISLLMASLASNIGTFKVVGGSNLEIGSDEKLGDKKVPKKDS